MSRRLAIASLLALGLTLALTSCDEADQANVPNDSASTTDVGNPAGDPNGNASPSSTFKLAKLNRTASFDGTQADSKGGSTYTVTVQLGKPQMFDPDLTVSPDDDVVNERAVNLGSAANTIQQDAQDDTRCINTEKDWVIPFNANVTNTGDVGGKFALNFSVTDKDNNPIPPLTGIAVSMIYRSEGENACDINAGVAEFNSLPKLSFNLEAGEVGQTGGFLVLHNVTTQANKGNTSKYKNYELGVTTAQQQDLVRGYDALSSFRGFDGTIKSLPTNTADGVPTGGNMLLVK